jgi:thioredoxin reductase (NADPH)
VVCISAPPAGYTAAVYAARAKLNPLVFEGSVTAGPEPMMMTSRTSITCMCPSLRLQPA